MQRTDGQHVFKKFICPYAGLGFGGLPSGFLLLWGTRELESAP